MQDWVGGGGKRPQRARDVGRKRKAGLPKKRLHILLDLNSKAFPNWQDVQGMWTLEICEEFIDWCHMGKAFPLARHSFHRSRRMANLKYCTHEGIIERCIQVSQHLYGEPNIPRNEVTISILRMVYAEVELGRTVDYRTMRHSVLSKIILPDSSSIPWTRKFPEGGLKKVTAPTVMDDDDIQWSATSSDDDKTGCPSEVRRGIEQAFKHKWLESTLNDMAAADEGNGILDRTCGPSMGASTPMSPRSPRTAAYIQSLEEELRQSKIEVEESRKKIEDLELTILTQEETISVLQLRRTW